MRETGVTRCLPTLITSSFDRFAASARILAGIPDARSRGSTWRAVLSPGGRRAGRAPSRTRHAPRASTISTAARTQPAVGSFWSRWRRRFPARWR